MSVNVITKYLSMSNKHMEDILKFILGNKFNKQISEQFLSLYFETRYNGLIENKRGLTVRSKLLSQYRELKKQLEESDKGKIPQIEALYNIFDEVTYFDTAIFDRNYNEKIEFIYNEQVDYFDKPIEKSTFEKELLKIVQNNQREKLKFIKKFDTNEFRLQGSNINENIKKISITHNIKFPSIYSSEAIEKAFNMGTTKEDKLFVEFYLISIRILLDVIKSDYRKRYIVDIDSSLLNKAQKISRLFEVVNNPITQDRIIIQIKYSELEKNKMIVYDYISQGYKFAIELDKEYVDEKIEAQKLEVFEYILASKEYKSLKGNDKVLFV